jgi:sugar phosphate isomerase/epimerase
MDATQTSLMTKSWFNGVQFGVQPFCYHDMPAPEYNPANRPRLIQKIKKNGFGLAELHAAWCEPTFKGPGVSPAEAREKLRAWRVGAPADYYQNIRKEFDDAGIAILNIYVDMDGSGIPDNGIAYSDAEIDATFKAAKILGAGACVGSEGLKFQQRLAPFAEKNDMINCLHNHANVSDPDAITTEDSFLKGFAISPNMMATFDTRHYTAANGDCLTFLNKHHERIRNIHLGNRKKNQGRSAPFGEGDTPIKEILVMIRDNHWPIPVILEFEHGTVHNSTTEVQLTFDYCKKALS